MLFTIQVRSSKAYNQRTSWVPNAQFYIYMFDLQTSYLVHSRGRSRNMSTWGGGGGGGHKRQPIDEFHLLAMLRAHLEIRGAWPPRRAPLVPPPVHVHAAASSKGGPCWGDTYRTSLL